MTLKQHAQSLIELGHEIIRLNPLIKSIDFDIPDVSPFELEEICKETSRVFMVITKDSKKHLRYMIQPKTEMKVTVWATSTPVIVNDNQLPEWQPVDNIGTLNLTDEQKAEGEKEISENELRGALLP